MSELRSFGLKSLKIGDIPDDGTMSTMLAPVGLTYQDSASLKEADAAVTDVFAEEEDFPVETFEVLGQTLLAWSIMDYTPATLAEVKGGAVVNGAWQAPASIVHIEKAVQIITKKDLLIEIPRLRLRAVINMAMKKKGIDLIDIKAPVLQPNNAVVAPISISKYAAPVVDAGNDASVAIAVHEAALTGTATPYRGTATYAWTQKSKPVGGSDVNFSTPDALETNALNLEALGDYVFTLTVTDSNGYIASDDVTITITA